MSPQMKLPFSPVLEKTYKEWKAEAINVWLLTHQTKQWIDISGQRFALRDMPSTYLNNVRSFLLKQADYLHMLAGFGEIWATHPMIAETRDKHDIPLEVEEYEDPREWLLATPLLHEIDYILDRRHEGRGFEEVSDEMLPRKVKFGEA